MRRMRDGRQKPVCRRKLLPYLRFFTVFFLFCTGSCIYDDLGDCRQGIHVHFFTKTPCSADTLLPQPAGLGLYVFDREGMLVSYRKASGPEMEQGSVKALEAENGLFTVVVWGGLDDTGMSPDAPVPGVTTKGDLLLRLQQPAGTTVSLTGKRVYFGESPAVYLPDPAEYGSLFETVPVNLQEITNRVKVEVEGLPRLDDTYEIAIESANGAMNIDGTIAPGGETTYGASPVFDGDGVLEADFTILKLTPGYHTSLVIKDKQADRELYRGDLLGTLLLKNPEINPECDHDFVIRFTVADQCECGTYMIMEIWVNNWLVHSYGTDL